jgi:mannose-6-phosphate isomerase-like protein (cupin superfamily)
MVNKSDPRKDLLKKDSELSIFNEAHYGKFYEETPTIKTANENTWVHRGQNFYVLYSEFKSGAKITRSEQLDEYVIISPNENAHFTIEWQKTITEVKGKKVVFVPPGESVITFSCDTSIVRLITTNNKDLNEMTVNKQSYATAHHHIPPFQPWPEPFDGHKVRVYDLNVAPDSNRFGTIYRGTTFMINALDPLLGPRDSKKLSPHSHKDFQQCSLAVEGKFTHHLRWPWAENKNNWQEDQHGLVHSPSITVIPPGVIHTTEAVGEQLNRLIDIFCPPRKDFSNKDGWVLNADEYPMPEEVNENE